MSGRPPGPDQYLTMMTMDEQQIRPPVESSEEFTEIVAILNNLNPEYKLQHKSIG